MVGRIHSADAAVPHGISGALFLFVSIRFLFGAGEAVVYPASNQFVSRWIPTQERGIANGWIFAGVGAGAGLSPPLITFIMLHYGWRASFWFCAVIGLVVGLVWYISARDTPAEHSGISASELSLIHAGIPSAAAGTAGGRQLIRGKRFSRARKFWRLRSAISRSAMWPGYSSAGFIPIWRRFAG